MSAATISWDLKVPETSPTGSALGITEVSQVKKGPGRLFTIICVAAGAITLLDGSGGNGETLLPAVQMTAGQVLPLDGFPFFDGLYVSAVTGEFNLSFT